MSEPDESIELHSVAAPLLLHRVSTYDPIIVQGACGGKDISFQVTSGMIPDELRDLLREPFSEPERQRLFLSIDMYSAEHIPIGFRPQALWIFGPPAVGKTTLGDEKAFELFGRAANAVLIDGDDIRSAHTGFQAVALHGMLNHVVHADAWDILKKTKYIEGLKKELVQKAIQNRQNLKIPDAAMDLRRVKTMLEQLEAANYEMHAICLWAPMTETQLRGRSRSVKAGKIFSTKSYTTACEGTLELAKLWEERIAAGSDCYKSISYYDNTVKPCSRVHLAQFEILTNLSREDADRHAANCKAGKLANEKADVVASEAKARGLTPALVARIWLDSARKHKAELVADATKTVLDDTMTQPFELLDDVARGERRSGRAEGCALGLLFAFVFFVLSKLSSPEL